MAPVLTWQAAALRLALTVAAGALIGVNRGERGHAAGLRTTILVSLAAAVAMLQVSALLPLAGKPPSSFIVMDLMRLPLGILSGMGFIGAGAILRKGSAVLGVTTAATLWTMTVVGLCFGGGQLALGAVATGLAVAVLGAMKRIDVRLPRERRATLVVVSKSAEGLGEIVEDALASARLRATYEAGVYDRTGSAEIHYVVRWRGPPMESEPSRVIARLAAHQGVESIRWNVEGGDTEERF